MRKDDRQPGQRRGQVNRRLPQLYEEVRTVAQLVDDAQPELGPDDLPHVQAILSGFGQANAHRCELVGVVGHGVRSGVFAHGGRLAVGRRRGAEHDQAVTRQLAD